MYNHTIVRDSILCPFHHHPICSLQFIRQNPPSLFCRISSPFSTWPVHSFCQRTPLRNVYIVHVPQQPLGVHDGTLGIYMNTIRKSICMGLTACWQSGTMQPYTLRHSGTSLGEPNHSFRPMLCTTS